MSALVAAALVATAGGAAAATTPPTTEPVSAPPGGGAEITAALEAEQIVSDGVVIVPQAIDYTDDEVAQICEFLFGTPADVAEHFGTELELELHPQSSIELLGGNGLQCSCGYGPVAESSATPGTSSISTERADATATATSTATGTGTVADDAGGEGDAEPFYGIALGVWVLGSSSELPDPDDDVLPGIGVVLLPIGADDPDRVGLWLVSDGIDGTLDDDGLRAWVAAAGDRLQG